MWLVLLNGLGRRGVLDRVSVDGTWWIHAARCEQIAYVQDGLLRALSFARTGPTRSYTELMAENLRALMAAYGGFIAFPGPARVPDNLDDACQVAELQRRVRAQAQLDFLELMAGTPA
jgi:hypothetical protein